VTWPRSRHSPMQRERQLMSGSSPTGRCRRGAARWILKAVPNMSVSPTTIRCDQLTSSRSNRKSLAGCRKSLDLKKNGHETGCVPRIPISISQWAIDIPYHCSCSEAKVNRFFRGLLDLVVDGVGDHCGAVRRHHRGSTHTTALCGALGGIHEFTRKCMRAAGEMTWQPDTPIISEQDRPEWARRIGCRPGSGSGSA